MTCCGRSRRKRLAPTRRLTTSLRPRRATDMTSTRPVTRATGSSAVPQLIFGDLWEYDPAPETADPRLKARYELFIGGKIAAPEGNTNFDSQKSGPRRNPGLVAPPRH